MPWIYACLGHHDDRRNLSLVAPTIVTIIADRQHVMMTSVIIIIMFSGRVDLGHEPNYNRRHPVGIAGEDVLEA